MSFKVTISDVLIANEALAMLPAEPIASMNEQSIEARECRRFYKSVVAELLEQHHWELATKRAPLAVKVNDRGEEWPFAYAKPSDMAFPVSMLPTAGGAYFGWSLQGGSFWLPNGRRLFQSVGSTIYSIVDAGTLEYTSYDITEANFSATFKNIVVLELAARINYPVTKNATRGRELLALSEGMRQRAIARDLNRSQPTYGNSQTEGELTRFGAASGQSFSYALDPVANPANTGN